MTAVNSESMFAHFVGFKANFREGFESAENTNLWTIFSTLVPSGTREEFYQWLGQVPRMREWAGDRVVQEMEANEYRIKNKDFEVTIGVKRNDLEDGQNPGLIFRFRDLGIAAAEWPNEQTFDVLKNGESLVGYDGVPLFSTAHEMNGTQSNYDASGGGEPWILVDNRKSVGPVIFQLRQSANLQRFDSRADAPMFWKKQAVYGADTRGAAAPGLWFTAFKSLNTLDETNFDAAMALMMGRKNDEGRGLGVRPRVLITTPANRARALELLRVDRLASGATNKNFQAVDLLVTELLD